MGKIKFYGPETFIEQCSSAINEELEKYDKSLKEKILSGKINLTFFHINDGYAMFYTVGLYSVPKQIWSYGSLGICQYMVFRYIQTLEIGIGLSSALKDNSQRHKVLMKNARAKMTAWLIQVKYPGAWIDCYK